MRSIMTSVGPWRRVGESERTLMKSEDDVEGDASDGNLQVSNV